MIIALILVLLLALAYGALQGLLGHGPFRFLNTMYLKSLPGNAEIAPKTWRRWRTAR